MILKDMFKLWVLEKTRRCPIINIEKIQKTLDTLHSSLRYFIRSLDCVIRFLAVRRNPLVKTISVGR